MQVQTTPPELEARVKKAIRALDDAEFAWESDADNPLAEAAMWAAFEEAQDARAALSEWTA